MCESEQWRQSSMAGKGYNSWDDVQRRTPGWMGGGVARILGIEGAEHVMKTGRYLSTTRNGAMKWRAIFLWKDSAFQSSAYDLLKRKNTFTSIQVAMSLSRAGHRFTHDAAPAGSGCPGQYPEQNSAERRERIFQVSPSIISIVIFLARRKW